MAQQDASTDSWCDGEDQEKSGNNWTSRKRRHPACIEYDPERLEQMGAAAHYVYPGVQETLYELMESYLITTLKAEKEQSELFSQLKSVECELKDSFGERFIMLGSPEKVAEYRNLLKESRHAVQAACLEYFDSPLDTIRTRGEFIQEEFNRYSLGSTEHIVRSIQIFYPDWRDSNREYSIRLFAEPLDGINAGVSIGAEYIFEPDSSGLKIKSAQASELKYQELLNDNAVHDVIAEHITAWKNSRWLRWGRVYYQLEIPQDAFDSLIKDISELYAFGIGEQPLRLILEGNQEEKQQFLRFFFPSFRFKFVLTGLMPEETPQVGAGRVG